MADDYLFENFFIALSALFWAFVRRVAVYLLRTVESSGLLYAAGGNLNNCNQKSYSDLTFYSLNLCLSFVRLSSNLIAPLISIYFLLANTVKTIRPTHIDKTVTIFHTATTG